ncbi:MAG TPA: DUF4190 domain-containing protein [Polyangia bacterium]|jgi:hypothetical protein
MGIAALVLGIIAIILAFFGGVGGIVLGIAAVILGVLGRRAAERDGLPTGSATAGLITGIIGIVLGGLIFAACLKCASGCAEIARGIARLGESQPTVDEIFRLEAAYYETEHADAKGDLAPRRFVSAGPTPAKVPCQEQPVVVTAEEWRAAGWEPLRFAMEGPTRFQFQAIASGEGQDAQVIVTVRTDPNCKGIPAQLNHRMIIDEEGHPTVLQSGFSSGPSSQPGRPGHRRRGVAPFGAPRPGSEAPPPTDVPDGVPPPRQLPPPRPAPAPAPAPAR